MKGTWIDRFATWETFLGAITVLFLLFALLAVPAFPTAFNLSQAAAGMSERALIALPMALLIIAREIDLSVSSILALTSVVFGMLVQAGAPIGVAGAAALLLGAAAGALNGALVTRLGLPSLLVTLGTLALYRGVGYMLLGSTAVNEFPDAFTDFGINTVGSTPVPWTLVPFLLLAPVFTIVLQRMPLGRRIYAVGGSPDAARYAGVHVNRIRFGLFVVSGLVCALAGIVFTARLANARPDNAIGMELDVITVALLGGISVFGGRGKLTGVFWAITLIAALRNVLGLWQVGGDAQGTITGLLLIVSLLLSSTAQRIYLAHQAVRRPPNSAGPRSGRPAVATDNVPNDRM